MLVINIVIFLIASIFLKTFEAARYEFVFDNDQLCDSCPDILGNNGINDLFDLSDLTLEYSETRISITGNMTCVWEGVQPGDRIEVSHNFYFI